MTDPTSHFDSRAEELFSDYLARRDAGEPLDFEAFCREHSEFAPKLRALKASWEVVRRFLPREEGAAGAGADPGEDRQADPDSPSELFEKLRARGARDIRYKLRGEVARGGMGVIFRVWDDELRRPLAMKVILGKGETRSGDTPEVDPKTLGRFLEEAQITGQLDHPGIVPVHELGLDSSGRVFFTMRLVKGEDLRAVFEHVKTGHDGWNQVRALGVLLKVCEAMSYAHAKNVIHRDLKPANVMVGRFGEVYVMDWGLARILGREGEPDLHPKPEEGPLSAVSTERDDQRRETPDSPLLTEGGKAPGTPSFMAPEQAKGQVEQVGPHSDVYSIGAMLYQLVTGEMPYVPAGSRISPDLVLLAVVNGPPQRVEALAPRTPPELVAIVEKAMARNTRKRYPDTEALAADLRAYLEGRVVAAYEAGAWAETKKWLRRNKPLAASLAAAVLAIAGGAVVSLVQAERAKDAATLAKKNETRALKVTELVQNALISSDPNEGGSHEYKVVEAMESAIRELDSGALKDDPETEAALQVTISRILDGNGRSAEALRLAEQALATRQRLYLGDHPDAAESLNDVAFCLQSLGRSAEALSKYEEALEMWQRLFPGDHPDVATGLNNVALCLHLLGRSAEALPKLEEALEMTQRLFPGDHLDVATSLNNVAGCLLSLGRSAEALPKLEEALEMTQRLFPGDHPGVAKSLNNVAGCLQSLGRSAEALPKFEEALEMRQRLLAKSLNNVAGCLLSRLSAELKEVLEMTQLLFPIDHPDVATGLSNVAGCLRSLDRSAEALPKFEEALEMWQRLFPGDHPDVAKSLNNLASCLKSLGRSADALPRFEEALGMCQRLFPGDHRDVARSLNNAASCLHSLGRSVDALPYAERAQAMAERVLLEGHPWRKVIEETLEKIRSSLPK